MNKFTTTSLTVLLFAVGCADADIDTASETDTAPAPVEETAPEATVPAPVEETAPLAAPEVTLTEEPDFMTECLEPGTDLTTCRGLHVSWLHWTSHEKFMTACTAQQGTSDDAITTCQSLWLYWWPRS